MSKLDYGTSGYKGLSYSRLGTFHTCARKYQIENSFGYKERIDSVTFAFGHAVGAGVQDYFINQNLQSAVIATANAYTYPWNDIGTASEIRAKKNVWYAIYATQCFVQQIESILVGDIAELRDWEIATFDTDHEKAKAAVELQFRILLDNDFVYEGHIDLILKHKTSGEYAILELKTTGFNQPNRASYGKSSQALAYSIVLDHAVGHTNTSYKVFYLVWSSSSQKFTMFPFVKQAKQRLNWLNDLIRETELLEYYQQCAEDGIPYPINGQSCFNFFRECEYFTTCEMEDESIAMIYGEAEEATSFDYTDNTDFIFSIEDIINTQLDKVANQTGADLSTIQEESNGQFTEI